MPRGATSKYTNKQERKADHIAEGYEKRGVKKTEAERRAWATVNKDDGDGKNPGGSGRGARTEPPPHIRAVAAAEKRQLRGRQPRVPRRLRRRRPRVSAAGASDPYLLLRETRRVRGEAFGFARQRKPASCALKYRPISSRWKRDSSTRCRAIPAGSSSRSGTASVASFSATAARSSSRPSRESRSIASFLTWSASSRSCPAQG